MPFFEDPGVLHFVALFFQRLNVFSTVGWRLLWKRNRLGGRGMMTKPRSNHSNPIQIDRARRRTNGL